MRSSIELTQNIKTVHTCFGGDLNLYRFKAYCSVRSYLQLSQRTRHGLCELDGLGRLLHWDEAREQRHQLVLVEVAQRPVEEQLRRDELVARVDLAGRTAFQQHHL